MGGRSQEILSKGLSLRCKVRGWSMYPFIQTNDIILIEPKSSAGFTTGDIVFFRRPKGNYVVHRLVKKNGSASLITKGDNSNHYDEIIHISQVMGRVIQIERDGKQMSLKGGLHQHINRAFAWLDRGHYPNQTRLMRNLGRLVWLLEGRRIK